MQRQGGKARGADCNNIHRLVGRVKIGRNHETKSPILMQHVDVLESVLRVCCNNLIKKIMKMNMNDEECT